MPSYTQNGIKRCPKCKTETTHKKCPNCGSTASNNEPWTVRFRVIENGQEVNKRLSGFKTQKEAKNAYDEFMTEYRKKKIVKGIFTFNNLYYKFHETKKRELKPSSIYTIEQTAKRYILPFFGEMDLYKITAEKVLEWKQQISDLSLSQAYNGRIYTILNSIFRFGNKIFNTPNPAENVGGFKGGAKKQQMNFWTEEEFTKFISSVDDLLYKTLFSFLYLAGTRRGETLALEWSDIDFNNKKVFIHRQCDFHVPGVPYILLDTPKNESSIRYVYLPDNLIALLVELKKKTKGSFVFNGNRPIAPENIRRNLKLYCAKSNVKIIRIHDFRHSHASLLINKGNDILAVAQRLGHSNIEQTLNTYAHMFPDKQKMLLLSLDIKL